jgi:hypothetical protein
MVPGGREGPQYGKPYFSVFILKKNPLLQNQQANINQTWYKSSLGKGNSKLYNSRARSFSRGEIIAKMQKWGGVI